MTSPSDARTPPLDASLRFVTRNGSAYMENEILGRPATTEECVIEIERLTAVAVAAKSLVAGARSLDLNHAYIDEASLIGLETALAAAGYDMSEEEVEQRLNEEKSSGAL